MVPCLGKANNRNINKNPFWSSVVNAVILFQAIHLEDHPVILPHNEPIWFNPILKIPYTKKWDTKGLRYVGDLLDDTASIKSREQIKKDFGIAINLLTTEGLQGQFHLITV